MDSGNENDATYLQPGTRVAEYEIKRILGAGGFGLTYLAEHTGLQKSFAIKEYFPRDFALRTDNTVTPRTDAATHYKWGLNSFIEEARMVARFNHPSIVRVHHIFEANDTAYLVLEYLEGQTLSDWLRSLDRKPTQAEIEDLTAPLLDALEIVHAEGMLHRDISPANIFIRKNGTPVLLDFGSARMALASHTRSMTVVIKTGFSPPEQYTSDGKKQGPWTDIYALGATLYRALTGNVPQEATSRQLSDEYVPAQTAANTRYTKDFLGAIDRSLNLMPDDRPQTVAAWRNQLFRPASDRPTRHVSDDSDTTAAPTSETTVPAKARNALKPANQPKSRLVTGAIAVAVSLALGGVAAFWMYHLEQKRITSEERERTDASEKDDANKKAQLSGTPARPDDAKKPDKKTAPGPDPEPSRLIKNVYLGLMRDEFPNNADFTAAEPAKTGQLFTPSFRELLLKDQQCWTKPSSEGRARLWFDGQDHTINDVSTGVTRYTDATQTVAATFKNFGKQQTWQYIFVRQGPDWLINDVIDQDAVRMSTEIGRGCYTYAPTPQPAQPSLRLADFYGRWVDANQYTCRSFDGAEGEWFQLEPGVIHLGYGYSCKATMSVSGSTLQLEGRDCWGEEINPTQISHTFTLANNVITSSTNTVYIRCPK